MADDERMAYRRRFSTLFVDEASTRRGGLGMVTRATNMAGEPCALKTLVVSERGELESQEAYDSRVLLAREAFRAEYESQKALSGFKGFPRLYGFAEVGGSPAIVMEWIEGVTLATAAQMLAVDDSGRMAPLVAARLGRDLFDMLTRLELVGKGFVHRDISPSNVLVRTEHLQVVEQAAEGAFDLCLIDFGSSVSLDPQEDPAYTTRFATLRCATPSYAPPEMLSVDVPDLMTLRKSAKIDVYAAASVVFELLTGEAPFDLEHRLGGSPYRIKMDERPRAAVTAHADFARLPNVLRFEPDVVAIADLAFLGATREGDARDLSSALEKVDAQIAALLEECLAPDQRDRPTAEAMRDRLERCCVQYAENVERALRGERLLSCSESAARQASLPPRAVNRLVRAVGMALSAAALVVSVGVTAVLLDGVFATLRVGPWIIKGELSIALVALTLLLPAACGFAAHMGARDTRTGFIRGTAALACAFALLLFVASRTSLSGMMGKSPLIATLFLASAAGWCPLVLEYATTVLPDALDRMRAALPWSGPVAGDPSRMGPAGLPGESAQHGIVSATSAPTESLCEGVSLESPSGPADGDSQSASMLSEGEGEPGDVEAHE